MPGARALTLVAAMTLAAACSQSEPPVAIDYPDTATVDHVDVYHGHEVADPYRWLEDDVRENEQVKAWVDAQNEVTFAYLASIPERARIAKRMRELWDYESFWLPRKAGDRYFYGYNTGLQNQDVILVQQ
ncbi:MAG: S9 family peptidase, partial [Woeseiaceae bacterium]|nr:S9 family peptidase [Woeseiaceae bacterium]